MGARSDGEEGATWIPPVLRYQFELAMALVGCRSVADMCRSHVLMPAQ